MKGIAKKLNILIAVVVLSITMAFKAPSPGAIVGTWQEDDGVRTIKIYQQNHHFYGKILENKHQDKDLLTPGTLIMKDFVFDEDIWRGRIYLPAKDMTLKAKLILEDKNTMKSVATWGIFSKSKTWIRVN